MITAHVLFLVISVILAVVSAFYGPPRVSLLSFAVAFLGASFLVS